jgi:UDP-N-acetylmuramate--alanine ligase
MKKLKVGVLMGGKSIEREVSFNSGRTVCDHLDSSRYDIVPIFQHEEGKLFILPWHFLYRGKISDFAHRLAHEAQHIVWDELKNFVDFIYIALHGRFAEDGTVQGLLEILGIPYLGSKIFASALSMDKIIQKKFLQAHGIEVAKDLVVTSDQLPSLTLESMTDRLHQAALSFPYIIKPHKEGSSLGISVVYEAHQLLPAIHTAATAHPGTYQSVLIEEKLQGMEFTCIILTDPYTQQPRFMPPTEVMPEYDFFDYEQKYMPGRAHKFTPARCSLTNQKNIQETCWRVMQILGMSTISRTDGFLTPDGRVVIIDPNSLAGMAPSSFLFRQAAEINMSHTQLINHLIETELQQYGMLSPLLTQEKQEHAMVTKKRIAVLLGGASNEKEISLESGRNIVYKLSPHKYEVIPLFLTPNLELFLLNQHLLVHNSTAEIMRDLTPELKISWNNLPLLADFVFIALHGGVGENGAVQGSLEMLEIPYNGSSVFTSALCMDKFKTNQFLQSQGFDVPRGMLIAADQWQTDNTMVLKKITQTFAFPLIVKPHDDGCSVLVHKATNEHELSYALHALFAQKAHALIEEYIQGMELTIGVIGNHKPQALPPSQTVAAHGILSIEEKFLPGAGENQTPAPLPQDALKFVQHTIEKVYKSLHCKGYARIDCFYQNEAQSPTAQPRVVILEINTLPGMTPATVIFHQAAELGIKPMEFIDNIIELGFEEHRQRTVAPKEHALTNTAPYNRQAHLPMVVPSS